MKLLKTYGWIVAVVIGLVFIYSLVTGPYNKMVAMDESVQTAWSQVENQYQRRADLIPNLVATVKGVANFEQETLTAVIEARAKATKTDINIKDAQEMVEYQKSQTGLSQALSRLMMITENYPELKATQNFSELQVQIEGTENRITVSRKDFNEEVKFYNTFVRQFPNNITAMIFGFEKANRFEATEGAEIVPVIKF